MAKGGGSDTRANSPDKLFRKEMQIFTKETNRNNFVARRRLNLSAVVFLFCFPRRWANSEMLRHRAGIELPTSGNQSKNHTPRLTTLACILAITMCFRCVAGRVTKIDTCRIRTDAGIAQ